MIFFLFIGVALFLVGCDNPKKFTGGGTLDSVAGCGEKANVGFVLNACKDPATLNFVYQDKADGVKMKGGDILGYKYYMGEKWIKVSYKSMSKDEPGEGEAKVTFKDKGEGNGEHGWVKIYVETGPFAGYFNMSFVDGNVQKHECNDDCDD